MGRIRKRNTKKKLKIINNSSLKVNTSFETNLSISKEISSDEINITPDSNHENIKTPEAQKTIEKPSTGLRIKSIEIIKLSDNGKKGSPNNERTSENILNILEKEEALSRRCLFLKNEIMMRTKALFDKQNELAIKTSQVFSQENSFTNTERSPRVRVDIGKDEQIIMSGDGSEKYPVQINSMLESNSILTNSKETENSISSVTDKSEDIHQSITNTPKKSSLNHSEVTEKTLVPITKLFGLKNSDNSESNNQRKTKSRKNIQKNWNFQNTIKSTGSPILSQNIRRTRLKNLSLRNKTITNSTDENSQDSEYISCSIGSSNLYSSSDMPIVCSTFIHKDKDKNTRSEQEQSKEISAKNKSKNGKTNVTDKNSDLSLMELTKIPVTMPIVIRTIKLEDDNENQECQISCVKNKTEQNDETKNIHSNNQNNALEDCTTHSIRSSMNVNTSINGTIENLDSHKNYQNSMKPITENQTNEESKNTDNVTVLSLSLQVNTSVDSAKNLPLKKKVLKDSHSFETQKKLDSSKKKCENSKEDNDLENVSLIKRLSIISKNKNLEPSVLIENIDHVLKERSKRNCDKKNQNKEEDIENIPLSKRLSKIDSNKKKQILELNETNMQLETSKECENSVIEVENGSSNVTPVRKSSKNLAEKQNTIKVTKKKSILNVTETNQSIIENTPYPTSRSVLMKTMIRNNILIHTLDKNRLNIQNKTKSSESIQSNHTRKRILELHDTVILDSSDDCVSENLIHKEAIIIDESLDETEESEKLLSPKNSNNADSNLKKIASKRKLFCLKENSELISLSPVEIEEPVRKIKTPVIKNKNKKKQKNIQELLKKYKESGKIIQDKDVKDVTPTNTKKIKKKPRKIKSKKIVVKKLNNVSILKEMINNESETSGNNNRSSIQEFDLKKIKTPCQENFRNNKKYLIAVTGLTKEEKNLVKLAIKNLGQATLEQNVTAYTTHLVCSGFRTMNLFKGILRGCWLVNLDWIKKSIECNKWQESALFEMSHISKAVQENRRDRQFFGKAYVPDLFVTCGMMYVEDTTSPPNLVLKELIRIAGGNLTDNFDKAKIVVGSEGIKESWVLDSIYNGELQPFEQYKRKQ